MTTQQQEKIKNWQLHPSQRGQFSFELYKAMAEDSNIMCFTADLGFVVLDPIRDDMPNQFQNFGASEQCMIGAAVGATLSGRVVFCYSITTFLLYRGFEWLRNYVNHENISVRLIGSGAEDDYKHDGITHQPWEAKQVLNLFPNIVQRWPDCKEQIPAIVDLMVNVDKPQFLCLRR